MSKNIKDSEFIVKMCGSDADSYYSYKKKNFLN
jgi:hypothetical protein